ncbi:hypothetical protein SAMN04488105_101353 [Salipiger thiooxidans]|uniref:Uncharacterized protein n=1 Tax=Salipiger thiooxidans TaxID=282683 RepID=A0A1G7AV85_9RHOB|nr:hypothetical protein [Salipiger thiooxidans]SDE17856.1 hypothetical protein SAMN04488105_101353 [Salipiger thiooxidans]
MPSPSIPPAALLPRHPRRVIVAAILAGAAGVFAHCILPIL